MIMQVHDEIVFTCPEENLIPAIDIITEHMENPFGKSVKLNVDLVANAGIGRSYEEAK